MHGALTFTIAVVSLTLLTMVGEHPRWFYFAVIGAITLACITWMEEAKDD